MAGSSSNSSNQTPRWKYQIFLSFRGEDTRNNFTDHLFNALRRAGFKIYKDDEDLEKGKFISEELLTAIDESLLSVVIISKNYGSSTWCLSELVKILESRKRFGRNVLPIFYGVDPSVVRHQTGRFGKAFRKHEQRYGEEKEKIQRWREALKEVANLSGVDSKNQRETKLIEEIVADVWIKLLPQLPSFGHGLVGIDSRVKHVYSLLKMGLQDIRIIGIWGMGGVGKTTLADIVFKNIRSQFGFTCFLADVTKVSGEKDEGLVSLQRQLLFPLRIMSMDIKTPKQGKDIIRNQLCREKVLLVLDDVGAKSQLENLAGSKEWFGPGSRIIVTTRDMQLLKSHQISATYEVDLLSTDESLQLFRQNVFKSEQPSKDLLELSDYVVAQAGGLPLAVVLLGSFLCGRDITNWKGAVDLLKQDSHGDIQKILRISYDNLRQKEKDIFLDIACFFVGQPVNYVTQILESCGCELAKICIDVLIEKSLIRCDEDGCFWMHDLLQEMGKSIVSKECSSEAAKWSRLWSLKDIDQVFRNNAVNESIEAMALKLPSGSHEAHWDPEVFSNMRNLKLLIVSCDLSLPRGLKCLSSRLKVLTWKNYPLEDLPLEDQLDELVWLEMPNSKIRRLWNETQLFSELEFLNLNDSIDLTGTPCFGGTPKLKRLHLRGCESLVEVDPSFGQHKKLVDVDFSGCRNLSKLPIKLEMISLEKLSLNGCSNVKQLPEFGKKMSALKQLILDGTAITELPQSLGYLTGLCTLSLRCCKDIIYLPNTIGNLCSLSMIKLCGCILTYEPVPQDGGSLKLLLKTSGNKIFNIPCSCVSELLNLAIFGSLKPLPKPPTYMYNAGACISGSIKPSYIAEKSGFLDTVKFKEAGPRLNSKVPLEFKCLFSIRSSEIPAWLEAKGSIDLNYFVPNRKTLEGLVPNHLLSKSSAVSIIKDIPDPCHGDKCWKIFVCLVFDDRVPSHSEDLELYCYSEAIGADNKHNLGIGNVCINRIKAYHCPYSLIICCLINGWPYIQKKLKLTFYTRPSFTFPSRRGQILLNIFYRTAKLMQKGH